MITVNELVFYSSLKFNEEIVDAEARGGERVPCRDGTWEGVQEF